MNCSTKARLPNGELAPDNSTGASTIRLVLQQNSSTDLTVFDRLVSHRPRTIGGIHQPEIGWRCYAVIVTSASAPWRAPLRSVFGCETIGIVATSGEISSGASADRFRSSLPTHAGHGVRPAALRSGRENSLTVRSRSGLQRATTTNGEAWPTSFNA